MDRWTHRGREGGIVEGGMVGARVDFGCVWKQGKRCTLFVLLTGFSNVTNWEVLLVISTGRPLCWESDNKLK